MLRRLLVSKSPVDGAVIVFVLWLQRGIFLSPDPPPSETDPAADPASPDKILRARGFEIRTTDQTFEPWECVDG